MIIIMIYDQEQAIQFYLNSNVNTFMLFETVCRIKPLISPQFYFAISVSSDDVCDSVR